MALFGKKENKSLTGTVALTAGSSTVTGTGTLFTTECESGYVLNVGSNRYVIKSITNDTELVLTTNASANYSGAATLTEVPKFLSDEQKLRTFGVDITEASVTKGVHPGWVLVTNYKGSVASINITNPGTGYKTAPTVTFSGGTQEVAPVATAVVQSGKVIRVDFSNLGMYSGTVAPTVSFSTEQYTFNAQTDVSSTNDTITLTGHTFVTGDAFNYTAGTQNIGLTTGTYYAIVVDANTIKVAATQSDALSGISINLTAASSSENQTISGVTATGTVKMAGKFGRKKRETIASLKATSVEMGDRENTEFPNS